MAVEERGICAEAKLRWEGRDDAATDATLCRYADPIDPFTRIVIHPRARHHRQSPCDGVRADDLISGERISTTICESCRHHRDIPRCDQDRTLSEIDVEYSVDIAFYDGIVAQKISNCAIAIASFALGSEHCFINTEFSTGETT